MAQSLAPRLALGKREARLRVQEVGRSLAVFWIGDYYFLGTNAQHRYAPRE